MARNADFRAEEGLARRDSVTRRHVSLRPHDGRKLTGRCPISFILNR
jgi:hypothetical protein